jgi:hypothetical protein
VIPRSADGTTVVEISFPRFNTLVQNMVSRGVEEVQNMVSRGVVETYSLGIMLLILYHHCKENKGPLDC